MTAGHRGLDSACCTHAHGERLVTWLALVIVGFLVVVLASTIAACGRVERDRTRKHEIPLNRPAPTRPRRGRSRHLPPPNGGVFEVHLSTVKRSLKLRSQAGRLAPKPI